MTSRKPKADALLTRKGFRDAVFKRDRFRCLVCGRPAKDAHHILERRLFPDGGYRLDNGASLCEEHHLAAEATLLSCEEIRRLAGIKTVLLPPGVDRGRTYDKWGNEILPDGRRRKGPLFQDEGQRRILARAGLLGLFID